MAKGQLMRDDLTGKRFGRLVVVGEYGKDAHRGMIWRCRCDCGNEKNVLANSLKRGRCTSCGCYNKEVLHNRATHGHSRKGQTSPTYSVWQSMLNRCENSHDPAYRYYGGRGITVCESWHDFNNFLSDMGERPYLDMSIDRIDNSRGYFKENCRWATDRTQKNNTTRNIRYLYNGEMKTVGELAYEANMPYRVVYSRLVRLKWEVKDAVGTPVSNSNRYKSMKKDG